MSETNTVNVKVKYSVRYEVRSDGPGQLIVLHRLHPSVESSLECALDVARGAVALGEKRVRIVAIVGFPWGESEVVANVRRAG